MTCLIVSPFLIGLVIHHSREAVAALVLLAWCLLCWMPEVKLLTYAHHKSCALAATWPPPKQPTHTGPASGSNGADTSGPRETEDSGEACNCSWRGKVRPLWQWHTHAWVTYRRQPAFAAALALALLYLTVCSWGTLMTAYLASNGLPESQLAVFRG